jgi:CheY-like chemotaxis protein
MKTKYIEGGKVKTASSSCSSNTKHRASILSSDREGERSPQRRLLCVDDDVAGTTIRGQILESEGYAVVLKFCPLDALNCDLAGFDLAIVDFEMPGMNGRELFLRMRSRGARFPIILLSGLSSYLSHEDRVLFSRCVDKGEPVSNLLGTIVRFLGPSEICDIVS